MFFKRFKKLIDPKIGKSVIHFTTHGCQAQIHEFYYFGTIVDVSYPHNNNLKYYKVEVLKHGPNEKRDGNLSFDFIDVPSWYLQKFNENIFVAYD